MSSNQDADKFRVDVSSFNGFNHQEYTSGIYALALSDPKNFFKTRAKVVSVIKKKIMENFYELIYNVLTSGKLSATGTSIFFNTTGVENQNVGYPSQESNRIALGACASIGEILDDVLNIVMPKDINEIFQQKMAKVGGSSLL